MTRTRTTNAVRPLRRSLRDLIDSDIVAVVLSASVVLFAQPFLLRGPAFVERVTVVNGSDYEIHIEVSGEKGNGWVSLTTAGGGSTKVTPDVVDQGDVWVFRFRAQGRDGGELRLTRADLQAAAWSIEIPGRVIEQLRQLGAPPSP